MNPNMSQSETDQSETDSTLSVATPPFNIDNTNHWFANKCFSKYWNYYADARLWYLNHLNYQNAVNSSYYFPSWTASANLQPWFQVQQTNNRWRRKNHKSHKKRKKRYFKHDTMSPKDCHQENEEIEFEMEITDAMREFLAKSSEHKKQKEIMKEKESSKKETPCINIENVGDQPLSASHLPPAERPGVRRTKQMKQLYGKNAGSIHCMETALQMEFNRVIDGLQPKLWPNMPFKCIFH